MQLLRQPEVIAWFIATAVIGSLLVLLGIPMVLSITDHLAIIYLPLLIFVPIILHITRKKDMVGNLPSLTTRQLVLLVLIGALLLTVPPIFELSLIVEIILLFVLPLVITVLVYKISIKDLGFRSNLHNLIIALCLGFVYGSVNFLLVGFRELTAIPSSFYLIFETHVFQNAIPLTIAICLVAIALPEEFFFRSIIQSNLTERFGAIRGILLASLCFGFFHIPANLTAFMFIGFDLSTAFLGSIAISFIAQAQIGIILGVAWYRTRSLLLPVSIHTAHNVAEIFPLIMSMMLWGF